MNDTPQWQRMRFKRNKVWLEIDEAGNPLMRDGKVRIKYQLDQSHEYWVYPSSVSPLASDDQAQSTASNPPPKTKKSVPPKPSTAHPVTETQCPEDIRAQSPETIREQCPEAIREQFREAIYVYTDGACSGNPGPAGIGIVMRYKDDCKEISRYIGQATNNIAELEAIRVGLAAIKNTALPVFVFTDSSYALGLLSRGWKAKRNQELVATIKKLMGNFKSLRFVKVKGHAGHPDNERADDLAVKAIAQETQNP